MTDSRILRYRADALSEKELQSSGFELYGGTVTLCLRIWHKLVVI